MLTRIGWVAALSLLLGIGLSSQAQAKTFEQRIAGAIELTARDVRFDDGVLALVGLLLAKGGPGSAQFSVIIEGGPLVANTDCPVGSIVQQPVVAGGFVTTFKDLSLLSGARGRGVACLDLVTGNISVVVAGDITGGNGRFEGATGSWQVTAEGEPSWFPAGFPLDTIGYRVTGTVVYDLD